MYVSCVCISHGDACDTVSFCLVQPRSPTRWPMQPISPTRWPIAIAQFGPIGFSFLLKKKIKFNLLNYRLFLFLFFIYDPSNYEDLYSGL
jgi:hypothetical protein